MHHFISFLTVAGFIGTFVGLAWLSSMVEMTATSWWGAALAGLFVPFRRNPFIKPKEIKQKDRGKFTAAFFLTVISIGMLISALVLSNVFLILDAFKADQMKHHYKTAAQIAQENRQKTAELTEELKEKEDELNSVLQDNNASIEEKRRLQTEVHDLRIEKLGAELTEKETENNSLLLDFTAPPEKKEKVQEEVNKLRQEYYMAGGK
jgi:hypothetical protein